MWAGPACLLRCRTTCGRPCLPHGKPSSCVPSGAAVAGEAERTRYTPDMFACHAPSACLGMHGVLHKGYVIVHVLHKRPAWAHPPAYAVEPVVVPSRPDTTQHRLSTARAREMTSVCGCGAPPSRAAA